MGRLKFCTAREFYRTLREFAEKLLKNGTQFDNNDNEQEIFANHTPTATHVFAAFQQAITKCCNLLAKTLAHLARPSYL